MDADEGPKSYMTIRVYEVDRYGVARTKGRTEKVRGKSIDAYSTGIYPPCECIQCRVKTKTRGF